jgi:hypothetical protein
MASVNDKIAIKIKSKVLSFTPRMVFICSTLSKTIQDYCSQKISLLEYQQNLQKLYSFFLRISIKAEKFVLWLSEQKPELHPDEHIKMLLFINNDPGIEASMDPCIQALFSWQRVVIKSLRQISCKFKLLFELDFNRD